nr:unnamed protein product [Salmo salar]|eukprot:XP_014015086.1 PREDICTED: carboxypeptidase A6-like [Salmo salar]
MAVNFRCAVQVLVLLGCVIILSNVLCPVGAYLYNNRYAGDQVFRITPSNKEEVQVLKKLLGNIKVDLWQPNSASLIRHNATVDVHVRRNDTRGLRTRLQREHIDFKVFISNLQKEIEKQTGHRSSRKRRSESQYDYEVYHSLEEVGGRHTHIHIHIHTHTHTFHPKPTALCCLFPSRNRESLRCVHLHPAS